MLKKTKKFLEIFFSKKNRRAASIFIGLSTISRAYVFIGLLISAGILSTKEFGHYALIQTILLYISLLHFGLLNAFTKEHPILIEKNNQEYADDLFSTTFLTTLIITIFVSAGISIWIEEKYNDIYLSWGVLLTSISIPFTAFSTQYFRANQFFGLFNFISFLLNIAPITLILIGAIVWPQLAVSVGFVISYAIVAITGLLLSEKNLYFRISSISIQILRKATKTGFPIFIVTLGTLLLKSMDLIVISELYPIDIFASYSFGKRISEVVTTVAALGIGNIYFPILLTYISKGQHYNTVKLVKKTTITIIAASLSISLLTSVIDVFFLSKNMALKYTNYQYFMYSSIITNTILAGMQMLIYYFVATNIKPLLISMSFSISLYLLELIIITNFNLTISLMPIASIIAALSFAISLTIAYAVKSR